MSRNSVVAKKPYCKVCFDAGKPESEYTSHWVRTLPDHKGKSTVTCPTLLNTECRYCYQAGHTIKFCKILEKHTKERERADRKPDNKQETKTVSKPTNTFASLCEDSDSDEEEEVSIEYPELTKNKETVIKQPEVMTGWAAVVAKPVEVKKDPEPMKATGLVLMSDVQKKEEQKVAPWANKQAVVKKSWADESDSDDDDEFDDYMLDEDLKWRDQYVPGMSDEVWDRINGETDPTW